MVNVAMLRRLHWVTWVAVLVTLWMLAVIRIPVEQYPHVKIEIVDCY